MKKLLIIVLMLPSAAIANPYFRLIDPHHLQPVVGALLAPEDLKHSSAASLLPLVTHSPNDGCMLPSIVCEDWTPLAVGASMNSGQITFDIAPLANVLPWMQRGAKSIVPASWTATRAMLEATPESQVSFSAGPVWEYRQATNKGYFRLFTGLALHF